MHIKTLLSGVCCAMLLAPAVSFGADDVKDTSKQEASGTPFVVVAPSEEIIVSFPLFVVERGVVESVDPASHSFTLKEKDGSTTKVVVTENTMVENIYADVFHWESKKGINDLKKGDKVRVAIFPGEDGKPATAMSLDVYRF